MPISTKMSQKPRLFGHILMIFGQKTWIIGQFRIMAQKLGLLVHLYEYIYMYVICPGLIEGTRHTGMIFGCGSNFELARDYSSLKIHF